MMTLIVAHKHRNLLYQYRKQGVVKLQKFIVITCCAIGLASCRNPFSVLVSEPQPSKSGLTFADWCLARANLIPEAEHTVEVLLQKAETTECDPANQKLSSLTRLELKNNQISDIKPLASLTKLTTLVLKENHISDIKPLASLTNLDYSGSRCYEVQ